MIVTMLLFGVIKMCNINTPSSAPAFLFSSTTFALKMSVD